MDNQHQKITGYRDLTKEEIDLMNKVKEKAIEIDALVLRVQEHLVRQNLLAANSALVDGGVEQARIRRAEPGRWVSISRTHMQEGLMALTRAVAQPTTF